LKCIPPSPRNDFYVSHRKFGYDRVDDDYKVLCLVEKYSLGTYTWKIYSLRSNAWRKLDVDDKNGAWVDSLTGCVQQKHMEV